MPPVQDDGGLDSLFHCLHGGFKLGNHTAFCSSVCDKTPRLGDRQLLDQIARFVEHAGDIGEEQHAAGLQGAGNGPGGGVGVDVEALSVWADAHGGDHRNEVVVGLGGQSFQYRLVDLVGLADKAEVDHPLDVRIRVALGAGGLDRGDQVGVGMPERPTAFRRRRR